MFHLICFILSVFFSHLFGIFNIILMNYDILHISKVVQKLQKYHNIKKIIANSYIFAKYLEKNQKFFSRLCDFSLIISIFGIVWRYSIFFLYTPSWTYIYYILYLVIFFNGFLRVFSVKYYHI